MADRPFIVPIKAVLTANGQLTVEYDVGQGNTFTVKRISQKSTGNFDIIDIADSFGNRYTNASVDTPIDGAMFTDIAVDNNNPTELADFIVVKANGRIQFTVKDTSGSSNTVFLYLVGYLTN